MSTSYKLTSTKPYLLRAFYEWIHDNNCTPYLIINANYDDVEVPTQYVDEGRIVLNISETAVRGLQMTNESIEFDARFGGIAMTVYAPIAAVMAIYAHENGRGMVFNEEEIFSGSESETTSAEALEDNGDDDIPPPRPLRGKPNLRIVK